MEQRRFDREAEMLYQQQHANMEARLRRRAESREAQQRANSADAADPFAGLDEALAKMERLPTLETDSEEDNEGKQQQPVVDTLDLENSQMASTTSDSSSSGDSDA